MKISLEELRDMAGVFNKETSRIIILTLLDRIEEQESDDYLRDIEIPEL